jgi:hypothetical protein
MQTEWHPSDGTPAEQHWASWLGKLLFVVERQRQANRRSMMPQLTPPKKQGRPRKGEGGVESESLQGNASGHAC